MSVARTRICCLECLRSEHRRNLSQKESTQQDRCHRIRRVRPELRVIISSATIEAQAFVDFFNTQPPSANVASSGLTAADDMLPPPAKKSRWDKQEKMPKSDAVMVRLEGRAFPVEVAYLQEPTADLVLKVVETIFDIHLKVRRLWSEACVFLWSEACVFHRHHSSYSIPPVTSWCSSQVEKRLTGVCNNWRTTWFGKLQ